MGSIPLSLSLYPYPFIPIPLSLSVFLSGHSFFQCSISPQIAHPPFPFGKGGCAICGDMEHWKNECPDRNTERDRKFSGNRGGKANSGRGKGKGGKQDSSGGDGEEREER